MLSLAIAVLPFAFITSITPGPNNIMVTASAANFGYRRTMPHMLGVTFGYPVMLILVGAGLGQVLVTHPVIHGTLKYAGAALLLYFAWRIARGGRQAESGAAGRPLTFVQGALFQWINVKAWLMTLGIVATYTSVGGDVVAEIFVIAAVFVATCYPSLTIWALFGAARPDAHL